MLRLIQTYLKPYRFKMMLILFLLFLQALTNLFLPALMSQIVDQGIIKGDVSFILSSGALMLFIALLGGVFVVIANLFSSRVALGFSRDLRHDLFSKVESFNLEAFDQIGTSSLITRSTNDVTQVQQVVLMALRMMVTAPLMIIGGLIMALYTNRQLSIILIFSIPVLVLVVLLVAKKGLPLFQAMQDKLDRVNLIFRENLTGIRVIRAFNKVDFEQKRFDVSNLDLTANAIKVNKIIAFLMPSMMIIMNLTSVAILWYGSGIIASGQLELGSLIAFIQYVMQIMMSLVMLTVVFVLIPRAAASAKRIQEVLMISSSITDPDVAHSTALHSGEIAFKHVTFYYPGSSTPALSDINFVTKPGKTTAIIGGTGSGKSTLIHLIPRFYDVSEGEICIGGVNIKMLSQRQLRDKIGLVPQKAFLFSGSIRDNLKYGCQDATDEALWEALETAQAKDFVLEKDQQLQAPVAQGGSNFSGGQKQRLSIARALVRKPDLYLFDDSFSALDFKTDATLRQALKAQTKNAAVIIVAQRITSIMDADEILVLSDGKVVGQGTHHDLLETCDVYREIALSQLSKEEMEHGK